MCTKIRFLLLAAAFSKLMSPTCLHAVTYYWDGTDTTSAADGGSGTWNTTNTNWDDAAAGGLSVLWGNSKSSDAVFGGAAGTYTITVGTVTGNDMTFNTDGYTLTGGTITLSRQGGRDNTNITVSSGVTTTIASALAGTRAITKDGSGKLILSGANSFTGSVTVSVGLLNIQSGGALGGSGSGANITAGAALEIQNNITVGTEAITLNGTGISGGGALRNVSGNNSMAGAITLGSTSEIASDAGTLTLSGAIGGAGRNLVVAGAGATTLSGVIGTTTGTLVKDDAGTLTLSGATANTFTGLTTVNAGQLTLNKTAGINALAGSVTVAGGTLALGAADQIANTAAVTVSGGTFALGANSDTVGAVTLTSGAITGSGGALTGSSFTTNSGSVSAILAGTGALTQNGGTTTLSGANTYTGTTTLASGTLQVTSLANGGTASGLGASSNAASNLLINGGATLAYVGTTNTSTDRNFSVTGNNTEATIANDGAGTVDFSNAAGTVAYDTAGQARTIALAGANAGDNVFRLRITDNSGAAVALKKLGAGKWIMTGTNTFTGATSVSGGTLIVNGSNASSAVTVDSGATFGGSGTVGAITLKAGATLSPGAAGAGSIGTLTAGSLVWNGGGTMKFDLGAAGASDKVALSGVFSKGTAGGYVFDFNNTGSVGTYTLVTGSSISGFTASDFGFSNLVAGLTGIFVVNPGSVVINVAVIPEPGYVIGAGALASLLAVRRRPKKQ